MIAADNAQLKTITKTSYGGHTLVTRWSHVTWLANRQNLNRKAAKGPRVTRHTSCSEMQLTAVVFSISTFTEIINRAPQLLMTDTKKVQNMPSAMPPVRKPKGTDSMPRPQNVLKMEKKALYADAVRCLGAPPWTPRVLLTAFESAMREEEGSGAAAA
jgi:hypothetical protein